MKEPQHPVGPAFDEARDEREAWRRQQIAALTPEQRAEYDTLQTKHDAQIEAKRAELREQYRGRIEQKMREYIAQDLRPELRPGKTGDTYAKLLKRLNNAIPDYAAGKETPETKALAAHLTRFGVRAHDEVTREHASQLRPMQAQLQHDSDQLLERCSRERGEGKQAVQDQSRDESWRRAFLKAAQQEAERGKDQELTKTFNRVR